MPKQTVNKEKIQKRGKKTQVFRRLKQKERTTKSIENFEIYKWNR